MGLGDDFLSEETLGGAAGGAAAGSAIMPGVGTAIGAGIGGLLGMYSHHKKNSVAGKYKGDLTKATLANDARMGALKQFYLDQQAKALGLYQPINHMFQASYGTEGIQAPQVPQGPGTSLASLYGRR